MMMSPGFQEEFQRRMKGRELAISENQHGIFLWAVEEGKRPEAIASIDPHFEDLTGYPPGNCEE